MKLGYREFGLRSVCVNLLKQQFGIFSDPGYATDTWTYQYKETKFNRQRFDISTCDLWNVYMRRDY